MLPQNGALCATTGWSPDGSRLQFSLRWLLAATTLVAMYSAVAAQIGWGVMFPIAFLAFSLVVRPTDRRSGRPFVIATALVQLVLIVGGWCCHWVWYTDSEIASLACWLVLIFAATFPTAFCACREYRLSVQATVFIAVVLGSTLLPAQCYYVRKLYRLRRETPRIAAYLETHRQSTGVYPSHLGGYGYDDDDLRRFVVYWPSPDYDYYVICFHVGSSGTCHEFSSGRGWSYYPD